MLDFAKIQNELAAKLAKELGDQLPDGIVEKVVGEALKVIGETLSEAGAALCK